MKCPYLKKINFEKTSQILLNEDQQHPNLDEFVNLDHSESLSSLFS